MGRKKEPRSKTGTTTMTYVKNNNNDVTVIPIDADIDVKEEVDKDKSTASQCNLCKKMLKNKYALKAHMVVHADKEFKCELCGMMFATNGALTRHKKCIHMDVNLRPFPCQLCEKRFLNKSHLDTHLKTHTGERDVTCGLCFASFYSKADLVRHMKGRHLNIRSFTCHVCNKGFFRKSYLKVHLLNIHMLPSDVELGKAQRCYACRYCKKIFLSRTSCYTHERSHNGAEEQRALCTYCGKTFSRSSTLKKHMEKHVGSPQYKCEYCDRPFFHLSSYKRHLNIHNRPDPDICQVCGTVFTNRDAFRRHLRKHVARGELDALPRSRDEEKMAKIQDLLCNGQDFDNLIKSCNMELVMLGGKIANPNQQRTLDNHLMLKGNKQKYILEVDKINKKPPHSNNQELSLNGESFDHVNSAFVNDDLYEVISSRFKLIVKNSSISHIETNSICYTLTPHPNSCKLLDTEIIFSVKSRCCRNAKVRDVEFNQNLNWFENSVPRNVNHVQTVYSNVGNNPNHMQIPPHGVHMSHHTIQMFHHNMHLPHHVLQLPQYVQPMIGVPNHQYYDKVSDYNVQDISHEYNVGTAMMEMYGLCDELVYEKTIEPFHIGKNIFEILRLININFLDIFEPMSIVERQSETNVSEQFEQYDRNEFCREMQLEFHPLNKYEESVGRYRDLNYYSRFNMLRDQNEKHIENIEEEDLETQFEDEKPNIRVKSMETLVDTTDMEEENKARMRARNNKIKREIESSPEREIIESAPDSPENMDYDDYAYEPEEEYTAEVEYGIKPEETVICEPNLALIKEGMDTEDDKENRKKKMKKKKKLKKGKLKKLKKKKKKAIGKAELKSKEEKSKEDKNKEDKNKEDKNKEYKNKEEEKEKEEVVAEEEELQEEKELQEEDEENKMEDEDWVKQEEDTEWEGEEEDNDENDPDFNFKKRKIKKKKVEKKRKPNPNTLICTEFICYYCDKQCSTKGTLKTHIVTMHMMKRVCSCHYCGMGFIAKSRLESHIDNVHLRVRRYSCNQCEWAFYAKADLIRHERRHSGIRPFMCHVCSKTFIRKAQLKTHIAIHVGERNYVCNHCGKSFITRSTLVTHLKLHSSNANVRYYKAKGTRVRNKTYGPQICPTCGKALSTPHSLNRHIESVHDNPKKKPIIQKAYPCPQCPLSFGYKTSMQRHMHKMHKLYKDPRNCYCPVCNRRLLNETCVLKHMIKRHPDNCDNIQEMTAAINKAIQRNIPCPICKRKYNRNSGLQKHLQKKHYYNAEDYAMMSEQISPMQPPPPSQMYELPEEKPTLLLL